MLVVAAACVLLFYLFENLFAGLALLLYIAIPFFWIYAVFLA